MENIETHASITSAEDKATEVFEQFIKSYIVHTASHITALDAVCKQLGRENPFREHYYHGLLWVLIAAKKTTLFVDFFHIYDFDEDLAEQMAAHYYKLEHAFRRAIQNVAKETIQQTESVDIYGIISDSKPAQQFELAIYNFPKVNKLRELRSASIGCLTSFSGTVTKTSEVRPELFDGVFDCMECGTPSAPVHQQFKYTEPTKCRRAECKNERLWKLNFERSVFLDWQQCKVQENSADIPSGSLPRSIDVILRGALVESAKAGDRAVFTGTLIAVPDTNSLIMGKRVSTTSGRDMEESSTVETGGVKGLKDYGSKELNYKLAFLACSVQQTDVLKEGTSNKLMLFGTNDEDNDEINEASFSDEELATIERIKKTPGLYKKMVQSIAPAVYGHEDIKRGILLLLFGGVHKKTREGINLRGDINVCIVGDPATAKSSFLSYVSHTFPRSVLTSGKASTAAGVTAAVGNDHGQVIIEAGALMLADNGICCIDEFDKMDEINKVALHEAMEQQTITIAKAGVRAVLNARTAILAAANPVAGRYQREKSLKSNLNIGSALMSRFDLFFVVLDDCDKQIDTLLAQHIVNVHRNEAEFLSPPFSAKELNLYIKYARTIKPILTPESEKRLVDHYVALRSHSGGNASRITVRQLEALVRLSEAIARVYAEEQVKPEYVDEAARLLQKSIIRIQTDDIVLDDFFDDSLEISLKSSKKEKDSDDIELSDTEQDTAYAADELEGEREDNSSLKERGVNETTEATELKKQAKERKKFQKVAAKRRQALSLEEYVHIRDVILKYLSEQSETLNELARRYCTEEKQAVLELVTDENLPEDERLRQGEVIIKNTIYQLIKDNVVVGETVYKPGTTKPDLGKTRISLQQ